LFLVAAAPASAQTYPSKTITIVSPAPAGGVTDIIGRGLAQRFSKAWGQQAVVENKPGANNQLAAEFVANALPDGHTLFVAPDGTFVANPSLYPKLPYDPYRSFTPITGLVIINHGMIAHPSFAPNSIKELLDLARQKPGEINYGTFGIGSSGHMNFAMLENMTGVKFQAVHYKGAAPAMNDVIAGHIPMMFVSAGSGVPQWKAGKVKYLAVGASRRMPQLPDVPAIAETVPGYEGVSWFGLFGPAGMPAETVGRINAEIRALFADPEFQTAFVERFMFQPIVGSPDELTAFIRKEEPKWRKIITEAKIKVE
jgi:tripartite-type tricarboxylate transporter receptor subunit TctC